MSFLDTVIIHHYVSFFYSFDFKLNPTNSKFFIIKCLMVVVYILHFDYIAAYFDYSQSQLISIIRNRSLLSYKDDK
jgi:hypothetical protein